MPRYLLARFALHPTSSLTDPLTMCALALTGSLEIFDQNDYWSSRGLFIGFHHVSKFSFVQSVNENIVNCTITTTRATIYKNIDLIVLNFGLYLEVVKSPRF